MPEVLELADACYHNDGEKVHKLLLSKHVLHHINKLSRRKYEDGELLRTTALNLAYEHSSFAIVQKMIKNGAKDISTSDGDRGIHRACVSKIDALAKVKQLVAQDPSNVHLKCGKHDRTPFFDAAQMDNSDVVEYLLNEGCNVHATGSDFAEAIHLAAWGNSADGIHTLIRWGAHINIQCSSHNTPLHWAAMNASVDAARALTSYAHCDMFMRNQDKQSALQVAKSMPGAPEITPAQYREFIFFMEQCKPNLEERFNPNVNNIEHLLGWLKIDTKRMTDIQKKKYNTMEEEVLELKKRMIDYRKKSQKEPRITEELQQKVEQLNSEVIEMSKEINKLKRQSACAANESEFAEASLLADSIRYKYKILVKDIASYDIVDDLFSKRALSLNDKKLINAEKTDTLKMKKLLDILLGKKSLKWAPMFVKILKQKPKYNKSLKQILDAHRESSFVREDIE